MVPSRGTALVLLTAGLAEHRNERLPPHVDGRYWRRTTSAVLTARSRFVLTHAGERLLKRWDGQIAGNGPAERPAPPVPHWDADRRELWFIDQLVKSYRVPASCQEIILSAFEEECWPPRIDDPLPMVGGMDRHERLREAVKGLNRGQSTRLMVFRRDGTGAGVAWRRR